MIKHDEEKTRVGLFFVDFSKAIIEIAKVSTFGSNKYSDHGWRTVPNKEKRYQDALSRHLMEYFSDTDSLDEESKLYHLAHAGWNILALLEIKLRNL
jgi:Domain of unknown function (DUF5664)